MKTVRAPGGRAEIVKWKPLDGDEGPAGQARQPDSSAEPEPVAEQGSSAELELDSRGGPRKPDAVPDLELPDERAALIEPNEEQSAEGVGRDAVPVVTPPQVTAKRKKPCCLCCKLCLLELKEMKIRDFRLLQFLGLVVSVAMLTADVWMDWALVIKWFLQGDTHWAETGLAINLLSGSLFGVPLALAVFRSGITRWQKALAAPAALLLGLSGLGPVAAAITILYDKDNKSGPKTLKMIAGVELLFEALPQSILQTYIGVAYGRFDPSSPGFSYLLPVSVCNSLLSAGRTFYGAEVAFRNDVRSGDMSLGSRYGIVGVLLRTAQSAALVFWIALLSCAQKGWGDVAALLSLPVYGGMMLEAVKRSEGTGPEHPFLLLNLLTVALLGLLGGFAAVFFGQGYTEGWVGAAALLIGAIPLGLLTIIPFAFLLFKCADEPARSGDCVGDCAASIARVCAMALAAMTAACATCLVCIVPIVAGTIAAFFEAEHMENNYANRSMPEGGPGSGSGPDDPQYFDCHERTSGLYPAYLATGLCLVLTPVYAALDPRYGSDCMRECMRGKTLQEKNAEVEAKIRADAKETADAVVLEAKIAAVWRWTDAVDDGKLGEVELIRLVERLADGPAKTKSQRRDDIRKQVSDVLGLKLPSLAIHSHKDNRKSIDESAFKCRCRVNPDVTKEWFEALELELVEDHGCLYYLCPF